MEKTQKLNYVGKGVIGFIGGLFIYVNALLCLQIIDDIPIFSNKKIESQKQLETVVKKEALKLGLDTSRIEAKYNAKHTSVSKNGEKYDLGMTRVNATRDNVKHELYHVKRDFNKPENKSNFVYYLFVQEPRATLYGAFGIKL